MDGDASAGWFHTHTKGRYKMLRWAGQTQPSSNPTATRLHLVDAARAGLSPITYKLWDWFRLTRPADPPLIRDITQGTGLDHMEAVRAWAELWRERLIRMDGHGRWFAVWEGVRVDDD